MTTFQMAVRAGDMMMLSLPSYPPQDFSIGSVFQLEGESWRCTDVSEYEITAVRIDPTPSI